MRLRYRNSEWVKLQENQLKRKLQRFLFYDEDSEEEEIKEKEEAVNAKKLRQ
jgi:hypothetical protein